MNHDEQHSQPIVVRPDHYRHRRYRVDLACGAFGYTDEEVQVGEFVACPSHEHDERVAFRRTLR